DFGAMVQLAHSLKGASGTIKAEPLRQACYELEQAARDSDAARIRHFTPVVLDLLEKTAAQMEALKPTLGPAS
ncbi:MAG TPA: Hpt domain-containing protein, partial [Holophagaceae bacterium]